jgi:hypothetical protein
MFKGRYLLGALLTFSSLGAYAAMDHSGHTGMSGGGSMESSGSACIHPHIDKIKPEKLATVSPGAEFSFVVFNIDKPEQVSVTVKQQPVKIKTEFKDPFYVVRGHLPDSLKNTAARIDVKISSKFTSCRLQDGWLLKISEN